MTSSPARPPVALPLLLTLALLILTACGGQDAGAPPDEPTAQDDSSDEENEVAPDVSGSLVVGSWGGLTDEATQNAYTTSFTEETGIDITLDPAAGQYLARVEAMQQAGNLQWDALDSASGGDAWTLHERGYLEVLPQELRTELEGLLGPEKVTEFGFTHGNTAIVIVCNMDIVDECPQSWAQFFDTDSYPDQRMFGAHKHAFMAAAAQLAGGVSQAEITTAPVDLDLVFEQLEKIKPFVRVFYQDTDQQYQAMLSGEAHMGPMTTGRAFRLLEDGMNVEIVWNEAIYEASYWAVINGTPNKEAAFDLLRWIASNTEGQAVYAETVHYSVPNPTDVSADILPELIDTPENVQRAVFPNLSWYAQHGDELLSRYEDYLRG